MRTKEEIESVLNRLPASGDTNYSSMTYEQGIEEALLWVRGDLRDDEFPYAQETP
jgi:hypothetical protein